LAVVTVEAKGLLFDLDGVLISSIASALRCWRRWAAMYDVPNAENFTLPHGMPARDIVILLRPDIDPDEGLRVIEDMEIEDVGDIQVLAGVRELLASLPPERWTIVTSCTRRLLDARLRAAGLPEPPNLVTSDMVSRGKPDPEPYRRGAEALGLKPEECIVVEDAVVGVQAGLGAGCRVLAVLSSTPIEELTTATWIAQSLDGVVASTAGDGLLITIPAVS
jgi:sugar-phosphatase